LTMRSISVSVADELYPTVDTRHPTPDDANVKLDAAPLRGIRYSTYCNNGGARRHPKIAPAHLKPPIAASFPLERNGGLIADAPGRCTRQKSCSLSPGRTIHYASTSYDRSGH